MKIFKHFIFCLIVFLFSLNPCNSQTLHSKFTICALEFDFNNNSSIAFYYVLLNDTTLLNGELIRTKNFDCAVNVDDSSRVLYEEYLFNYTVIKDIKDNLKKTKRYFMDDFSKSMPNKFYVRFIDFEGEGITLPCKMRIPDPLENRFNFPNGFGVRKINLEKIELNKFNESFVRILESEKTNIYNFLKDGSKMIHYGLK